jgi:hydroxyacylglutathione hydrolase
LPHLPEDDRPQGEEIRLRPYFFAMRVTKLCFHPSFSNTYVLGEENSPCLVIDPGFNEGGALNRHIEKHHGGKILAIALTHGHFDHFYGLKDIEGLEHIPLFVSELDFPCLTDPKKNASFDLASPFSLEKDVSPYFLEDGDETRLGPFFWKTIATPFHTKGSICFFFEDDNVIFSGDTLFKLGVGRDDLPHASPKEKEKSLGKIFALPDSTLVYPGHGPKTTIGEERGNLADYLN